MYSIGLDIGTTSVCGIAVDLKDGRVADSVTLMGDAFIKGEHPFESLQDANRLITLATDILKGLLAKYQVSSIGITGQMHGIVYLDAEGRPLSPLKIWQDGRGDEEYKNGLSYAEYASQKSGYPLSTGYGAVTYFYDSVNGLVPEDTAAFCTIHDLLAMTLIGATTPLTHPSDGASLGLFDLNKNEFDKAAIEALGLNFKLFPKVSGALCQMGKTAEGIPVSVAIGDNQASFLGSVADREDSILINIGTGGQISCAADSIPKKGSIDCRPLMENSFILAGSSLCGGRSYALLESLFREVASAVTGMEVKSAYPAMDRVMENYAKKTTLSVSTLFSGSRAEPEKRGGIEGIGTDNLTMADLCDGFMRGMANELYEMYEQMKPFIKGKKRVLIGSGNGIRSNAPLKDRFKELFGMDMLIPRHKEEAAFGAVLYSLQATGVMGDEGSVSSLIRYI